MNKSISIGVEKMRKNNKKYALPSDDTIKQRMCLKDSTCKQDRLQWEVQLSDLQLNLQGFHDQIGTLPDLVQRASSW